MNGGSVTLAILQEKSTSVQTRTQKPQAHESQADRVSWMVVRGVGRKKSIRGDDAAQIAKADLKGRPDGTTMVAAEVHVVPAENHRHGRVDADGEEEQEAVLGVVVVVDFE